MCIKHLKNYNLPKTSETRMAASVLKKDPYT